MTGVRLNKALASAGVCSRRRADELISSGAVRVNDTVVDAMGLKIDPAKDTVTVHGKTVALSEGAAATRHHYYLLHKPIQVVSTAKDPQGRPTVLDLLPGELRDNLRLYPVGRLDYFSEGLLLLTDDGELTNRLTHPRYHLPKVYEVKLRQLPTEAGLGAMRRGMTLREGEHLAPVEVEIHSAQTLLLTLHQGINRQIRRMCRDLGLTILTLRRVQLGPLELGDLPKGKCRPLRPGEVAALKKAVGLEGSPQGLRHLI